MILGFPKCYEAMGFPIVDGFEFCRQGQQASGRAPVAEFDRLAADLPSREGELDWSVEGGHHRAGDPQITLRLAGSVRLLCQRCLTPFEHQFRAEALLVLARDEADADATEARLDDDAVDVIVGSASMDLKALVEDEAMLSLPLSPRHKECPEALPEAAASPPESPFSVLKKLRR